MSETFVGKVQALVDALDGCLVDVTGIFAFAKTHGVEYTGSTYNEELEEVRAALRAEQTSKPVGWALMEDGKPRHVTLSKHAVDAWRRATNGDVRELFFSLQGDHDGE